jgi:hypothetical protein
MKVEPERARHDDDGFVVAGADNGLRFGKLRCRYFPFGRGRARHGHYLRATFERLCTKRRGGFADHCLYGRGGGGRRVGRGSGSRAGTYPACGFAGYLRRSFDGFLAALSGGRGRGRGLSARLQSKAGRGKGWGESNRRLIDFQSFITTRAICPHFVLSLSSVLSSLFQTTANPITMRVSGRFGRVVLSVLTYFFVSGKFVPIIACFMNRSNAALCSL